MRVLVLGYIVRGPLGGHAWHHLQYVLGLERLGHDVYFLEDSDDFESCYDPARHEMTADPAYGLTFAASAFERVGLKDRWAYYDAHTATWHGPSAGRALELCRTADVCLNVSGVNPLREWLLQVPLRVLIDTDPAFTQVRHLVDSRALRLASLHNAFATFGENVGLPDCTIPSDGLDWRPTRQPIVLEAWPVTPGPRDGNFSTMMQWESYPALHHEGREYGMKSLSFAPFFDLPAQVDSRLELALGRFDRAACTTFGKRLDRARSARVIFGSVGLPALHSGLHGGVQRGETGLRRDLQRLVQRSQRRVSRQRTPRRHPGDRLFALAARGQGRHRVSFAAGRARRDRASRTRLRRALPCRTRRRGRVFRCAARAAVAAGEGRGRGAGRLTNAGAILVTGGAGYVGSHFVARLEDEKRSYAVLDDLSRGRAGFVPASRLVCGDIADEPLVERVCRDCGVDVVVHFAAFAYVAESVADPALYYENNVAKTIALLRAVRRAGVRQFVFSSSCATYGETPSGRSISENTPQVPLNPYGRSKLVIEQILNDYDSAYELRSVLLRYFNAAGASERHALYEQHDPETHLIPLAIAAALGSGTLDVFGRDYATPDGTCIRDYVHVDDLADAHVRAVDRLRAGGASLRANLGIGRGASVLDVVTAVRAATGAELRCRFAARRPGDPAILVANADLARDELGWEARYSSILEIVRTALEGSRRARAASP